MVDNEDDLYIISSPPEQPDLKIYPFLENPLVVIGPKDHPLAKQANIPIEALNGEAFIMREPGSGTRYAVQKLFAEHNVDVKVRLELGSNEAIKQAIAGGLGISVLSLHTIISEGTNGEFAILDVEHFPIERHWYVASLGGKQLSVVAQAFLDYLLEESHMLVEKFLPGISPAPDAGTSKQVVGKAAKGSKKSGKVLSKAS